MALKRIRPWTPDDDRRLLEMRAAGRPTFSIVAALNRSAAAAGASLSLLRQRVINQDVDGDANHDIYRQQGNTDALVATHDFHNLISLRVAIIEHRGRSFVVREPLHATTQDRITLLDLRAQGFDIKIAMQG